MTESQDAHFFADQEQWRRWLEKNHDHAAEVWVGYYTTDSGKPSVTWPQTVDEALCFGWIDGNRKHLDDVSYKIRFTPRKRGSVWSAANVKRVQELTEQGRMQPAGLKVFEARAESKTDEYPYENPAEELPPEYEKPFRANANSLATNLLDPTDVDADPQRVIAAAENDTAQRAHVRVVTAPAKRDVGVSSVDNFAGRPGAEQHDHGYHSISKQNQNQSSDEFRGEFRSQRGLLVHGW